MYDLITNKLSIEYGSVFTGFTSIDIAQEYLKRGGKLNPSTKVDFDYYFPGSGYSKTALTDSMPKNYLCEGSGSAIIHLPDGREDSISISIYADITGHDLKIGDHHNLFLQYGINDVMNHTDEIPNRHPPLSDNVTIRFLVNGNPIRIMDVGKSKATLVL